MKFFSEFFGKTEAYEEKGKKRLENHTDKRLSYTSILEKIIVAETNTFNLFRIEILQEPKEILLKTKIV